MFRIIIRNLGFELDQIKLVTNGKGLTTIELVQSVSDIFARDAQLLLSFIDEMGANGKSIKALLMLANTRVTHENFVERKKLALQASLAVDYERHELKKNLVKSMPLDIRIGAAPWMFYDEMMLVERQAALNRE